MKAMKVMKAKRVSVIAKGKRARASVFNGRKEKTVGGMTKANLVKNKKGKIVSKAASMRAKRNYANSGLKAWVSLASLPLAASRQPARRSMPRPRPCSSEVG